MPWLLAILIGALCGVVGAVLTMMAGDSIIRLFRISTFEGAAGYLVVFILVPLGFLVGLLTGIVILRVNAPVGAIPILLNTGLATLATSGLLTAGYGTAYLLQDRPRPPTVDGKPLTLQFELRYRPVPGENPRDELIRASLYATSKDNSYLEVDPEHLEERDGWLVVRFDSGIHSRSATRILSVGREAEGQQVFELPLAPVPARSDSAWSQWVSPRAPLGDSERPRDPARACELRYRVLLGE